METRQWRGLVDHILYAVMFTRSLDVAAVDSTARRILSRQGLAAGPEAYSAAIALALVSTDAVTQSIETPHTEQDFRAFLGRLRHRLEELRPWPQPVSYEQARELVRQATEPDWPFGTYCLDDRQITENDERYVFGVGAREHLIDGDISFAVAGAVPTVVKASGALEWLPSVTVAMDPSMRTRPNPAPTLQA